MTTTVVVTLLTHEAETEIVRTVTRAGDRQGIDIAIMMHHRGEKEAMELMIHVAEIDIEVAENKAEVKVVTEIVVIDEVTSTDVGAEAVPIATTNDEGKDLETGNEKIDQNIMIESEGDVTILLTAKEY